MSVIVKLLSKFDDSGIKKARREFGGLKKFAGTLAFGIGIQQIASTLIDAAKAASADQKSMQLLNSQLTKNANATKSQVIQNDKFIESLSNQVGIVDDDLRPAQAKLARATGSVAQSQKLLRLALDASKVSGKGLDATATALAKAFNGNTTSLIRMFPELKKSKDAIGDLNKEVAGAAEAQASPFDKFNVALDNLKEKLGYVILPILSDLIDQMIKPGGLVDAVGKFLDDMSNPKTEAGQTFLQIKNAVQDTFEGVKSFFALFGNGDAMKGFANTASFLIQMLPALLALKGILFLSKSTTAIANLAKAIGLIQAGDTGTSILAGGKGKKGGPIPLGVAGPLLAVGMVLTTKGDAGPVDESFTRTRLQDAANSANKRKQAAAALKESSGIMNPGKNAPLSGNQIIINNYSADPKAVTDAVNKYLKNNGGKSITNPGGR